MMIEISVHLLAMIQNHGVAEYPRECCGILLGQYHTDQPTLVRKILPARNLADPTRLADRYIVDPAAIFQADKDARAAGLEIVGIYHSHPDHPALPSPTDTQLAWEGYIYLILSIEKGQPAEITAWRLSTAEEKMNPVELFRT